MSKSSKSEKKSGPAAAVPGRRRSVSPVWIVPLVALFLGAWLAYKHFTTQGVLVQIHFDGASGIRAQKTVVRAKDVEIGLVEKVDLSPDLEGVTVTARMDRSMRHLLREGSRFWVVKPRIGLSGITGVDTLLSGTYINFEAGQGDRTQVFTGLESPPPTPLDTPGLRLKVVSDRGGALQPGSPVYYRGFEVGRVEGRKFGEHFQRAEFDLFISSPHDKLVRENTRFWNAGGIDVNVGAEGLDFRVASLETLVAGGVTFDLPDGTAPGDPADNGSVFPLYKDYRSMLDQEFQKQNFYVIHFDQSVRGLKPGAPVQVKGLKIGSVHEVNLSYDEEKAELLAVVVISIEPDRIEGRKGELAERSNDLNYIQSLVDRGLRARLTSGNLLTGALLIELDFIENAEPFTVVKEGIYPRLPTAPGELSQIADAAGDVINKLKELDLDPLITKWTKVGDSASGTLEDTRKTLAKIDALVTSDEIAALPADLSATLKEVRKAAAGLSPDSPVYYDLSKALVELREALQSVNSLAERIEERPNSLIFGNKPTTRRKKQ